MDRGSLEIKRLEERRVYQRNVRSSKVSESRPPFVLIQFLIVINKAVTER